MNLMLDASIDCIKIVTPSGELVKINRAGKIALGVPDDYTSKQILWLNLLPPDIRRYGQLALTRAGKGKQARFFGRSELPGKKPIIWENILTPILDSQGNTSVILCLSRDVTKQKVAEERLQLASETDALTKLPNRRAFVKNYATFQRLRVRHGSELGLLVLDIDDFKCINDHFGHAAGDTALCHLARVFRKTTKLNEFAARLGGDEFALLVCTENAADHLQDLVTSIYSALEKRVKTVSGDFALKVSVGGAISAAPADSLSTFMRRADDALYRAKQQGKGSFLTA